VGNYSFWGGDFEKNADKATNGISKKSFLMKDFLLIYWGIKGGGIQHRLKDTTFFSHNW